MNIKGKADHSKILNTSVHSGSIRPTQVLTFFFFTLLDLDLLRFRRVHCKKCCGHWGLYVIYWKGQQPLKQRKPQWTCGALKKAHRLCSPNPKLLHIGVQCSTGSAKAMAVSPFTWFINRCARLCTLASEVITNVTPDRGNKCKTLDWMASVVWTVATFKSRLVGDTLWHL